MPKLGSIKRPAIVRVQTQERAAEIAALCNQHGWYFIAGIEPDKPEDITHIDRLLNRPRPVQAQAERKPGRNAPCPCGSGKKYKHCCGAGR